MPSKVSQIKSVCYTSCHLRNTVLCHFFSDVKISVIYVISEPLRNNSTFFFALKWSDCNIIIFKPNSLSKSDVNPLRTK